MLGHLAEVNSLRYFAAFVASTLRRDDMMVHLGGDEFVAVLQGYTPDKARLFAERVIANLASMKVTGADRVGVGVAMTFFKPGDAMDDVLDARRHRTLPRQKGRKGQGLRPYAPPCRLTIRRQNQVEIPGRIPSHGAMWRNEFNEIDRRVTAALSCTRGNS